ncbi:hypothetical protein [Cerasicoccus fimbriatus]|uniref:hypothetical protein n=1 Tax=Cerasicoccus fimbriatus TaxID=3014554 RepID=UPI0022B49380|nr:hypothetical protein [Cerasicoccus sp. TK19100]
MKLRLLGLLAIIAFLTGCSATVPIRPYMFIQNEEKPNAPYAVEAVPTDETA